MSKNIEIQINTGENSYEILYPKTLIDNVINGASQSYVNTQDNAVKDAVKMKIATGSWSGTGTIMGTGTNLELKTLNVGFFPNVFIVSNSKNNNLIDSYDSVLSYRFFNENKGVSVGDNTINNFIKIFNLREIETNSEWMCFKQSTSLQGMSHYNIYFTNTTVRIVSSWGDFVYAPDKANETNTTLLSLSHLNGQRKTYYWVAAKFYS